MTPAEAAARLAAYERVTAAAASLGPEGPPLAPVLSLSDAELAALFAPRQLDALVGRPLAPQPQHGAHTEQ